MNHVHNNIIGITWKPQLLGKLECLRVILRFDGLCDCV